MTLTPVLICAAPTPARTASINQTFRKPESRFFEEIIAGSELVFLKRSCYMGHVRSEVTKEKVRNFMTELGRTAKTPGRVFFTGGVSAVLFGWRESTMD